MVILNCLTLTRGEMMWTNQDERCLFTGQLLTIYALTLLSFQLQHDHRLRWSNQLGTASFSACDAYELYQAYKECVCPQKASKQNPRNLKKQIVVWINK